VAKLRTEDRDGVLVVHFGDPELSDDLRIKEISAELLEFASNSPGKKMLLSLDGVDFMNSMMFGQLVLLKKTCDAKGVALKLCNVGDELTLIFRTLQLDTLIGVADDESSALALLQVDLAGQATESPPAVADDYREAAEQGDAASQYALAKCYEEGRGVPQDFAEAFKWCEKAAVQGHTDAEYMLGTCYAFGIHVSQNYEQAVTWHEKAARQGHPDAQYIMGLSYNHGLAGTEDHDLAAQWYQLAATQGHLAAQKALAELESSS